MIGLLKSNMIEIIWKANTREHYLKNGYEFTSLGDSVMVKISDLPAGSHREIEFVCDYCLNDFKRTYKSVLESNSCYTIKTDCCENCFKYKNIDQKLLENGVHNREAIVFHLINNNIYKISGVYKIRNICNDKIYIGSSKNILNRWKDHSNELTLGTHISNSLTDDFQRYGIEGFEFSIIEYGIEKSKLVSLEHTYIREYRSDELDYGYNTVSIFKKNKNKSTNNTILNENSILEIKKRIFNKENYRDIAKDFGVKSSSICDIKNGLTWSHIVTPYDDNIVNCNEGKRVGESNGCSKLTENDVRIIKLKLKNGDQMTSIGKEFNVSRTLIRYIKIGKLWSHVY